MKINSSSLFRVMKCAGVVRFKDLPPEPVNEFAQEGTAAGEVLAAIVAAKVTPITVPSIASNGYPVDAEMIEHANRLYQRFPEGTLVEEVCSWVSDCGIEVSGRSDFVHTDETSLYLTDYKYGYTPVEAKENWQLLSYAIGETIKRGKLFDYYYLSILQPRAYHEDGEYRVWKITGQELIEYKARIDKRLNQIFDGNESLVTGDHCKYCRVAQAGRCGAFNQAAINTIEVITEKQIDHRLNNDQIARDYEMFSRMSDLLKIKLDSLSEQLKEKLQSGEAVGDYQLAPTGGRRVWKSGLTAKSIAAMTGLNEDTLVELISPAKFEKAIGKQPDLLNNFTVKVGGGFKITKGKSTKQLATAFAGIKGEK